MASSRHYWYVSLWLPAVQEAAGQQDARPDASKVSPAKEGAVGRVYDYADEVTCDK